MDNNNGSASSIPLSKEEKEARIIIKITVTMMAALKETNLSENQTTFSFINENQPPAASGHFKSKEIGFFDPELEIKDDSTITNKKL